MKLYEVPRNTPVVYTSADGHKYILDFKHVDGMYSLCFYKGEPFHLSASAEVEILYQ
jgi:hypothetical protein